VFRFQVGSAGTGPSHPGYFGKCRHVDEALSDGGVVLGLFLGGGSAGSSLVSLERWMGKGRGGGAP
jgi:hypothetical protein